MKGHPYSAERLRSFIERVERLEEEKAAIATDIKEVYAEAKAGGFDTKTMRQIVRLRKMSSAEREEHEALLDIYKAALGMLNDTPLGEAARRRLSRPPKKPDGGKPDGGKPDGGQTDDGQTDLEDALAEDEAEQDTPPKDCTVEDATRLGQEAAREGKPVTANPFPAGDPRRAAWDEAWCFGAGSDGMDIPEAWRRGKPKKPPEDTDAPDPDEQDPDAPDPDEQDPDEQDPANPGPAEGEDDDSEDED